MDENTTPAAAQPVSPATDGDQGVTASRFDGLDYRALQKEAANFDGVAGNLPEAELRAALIEADSRAADAGDTPAADESDEAKQSRRDRGRAAAGVPTSAERDAARDAASSGTQTTISPEDAIRRASEKLEARRGTRSRLV